MKPVSDFQVLRCAPLRRRFATYLVDSIALYAGFMVAGSAIVMFFSGLDPSADSTGMARQGLGPILEVVFFLLAAAYYFGCEFFFGQTLGKRISGVRVVNLEGGAPTWRQVLGRTAARFVPFESLSAIFAAHGPWHDAWSGTLVVLDVFEETDEVPGAAAVPQGECAPGEVA